MAGRTLPSLKGMLVYLTCICLSRWRVQTREAEPREVEAGRSPVAGQSWASLLGVILEPPGSRYIVILLRCSCFSSTSPEYFARTVEFTHRWTIDDFETKTRTYKVGLSFLNHLLNAILKGWRKNSQ